MSTPTKNQLLSFAKRLTEAMARKGWNGSDLARAVATHMPDKSFGRDNISRYRRALTSPKPEHLYAMAKALGMKPEELFPENWAAMDHTPAPTPEPAGVPALAMITRPDGTVELTVHQSVDMDTALKIVNILRGTQ